MGKIAIGESSFLRNSAVLQFRFDYETGDGRAGHHTINRMFYGLNYLMARTEFGEA
jgi:hypothetical protein